MRTATPSILHALPALRRAARAWGAGLAIRLFPPACVLCGADGADLCAPCRADLSQRRDPACPQCALPLASTPRPCCGTCLRHSPAFDRSLAATLYQPPFDQLVVALKYHAQLALAPLFAELLAARLAAATASARPDPLQPGLPAPGLPGPDLPLPDLLVPVPLGRTRLAERGYNQAERIARALGRRLGLPVREAAWRVRETAPQAELPHDQRLANLRGAFAVHGVVRDRVVGVVDDVMTTGATLAELAGALKQAGARAVINLVVARTPLE